MKRLTLLLAALLIAVTAFAFNNGLVEESMDPYADSVAIAKMRARMDSIRKVRPTVALVLSGGGAKGASHAGVLKFLEEKGVPIDLIGGTSMGGLVGGLYSAGNDADQLCGLFRSADWSVIMSDKTPVEYYSFEKRQVKDKYLVSMPFEFKSDKYSSLKASLPDGGLYGFNIYNTINAITVNYQDSLDFINLPIPFYCVATEVNSNKEKNIFSGYLPEALRATIAIPLVFKPVRTKDEVMLDGGLKNNFPVDIARAMGADIIIAVDLHTPDEPNNHIVNIMMNMLFGIGSHSYEKNKDASDIYIKPDMSGFWTMSFGKDEIAEIIQRGYDAAKAKEAEIDRLVAAVGAVENKDKVHNTIDLAKDKIKISSFGFEGMSEKDIRYFRDKIHFLPDGEYSAQDFEMAVAEIFSTGAFSSVRYKISGTQEPYSVIFECQEGPNHTLDIGLRIDTEQIIAAIANFGIGKNKVSGWQMDATVRLSSCPRIDIDGGFTPIVGPRIGLSASSSLTNIMNFQNADAQRIAFNFWRACGQIYIEDCRWSRVKLIGGARIDYSAEAMDFSSGSCVSAFADIKINSLDDSYFPTKGVRFSAGAEYVFSNITKDGWRDVSALYSRIMLEVPVSFGDRFTTVVRATGSDITGDSLTSPYRFNTLGGMVQGRYFDRQLPLSCINGVMICDDKLVTAELDLRVRIGEKNYVSAIGDFFADGPKWNDIGTPDWGVGLQYSRPTRLGGFFANVHWNSSLNTVGIYAGIGKSF